MVGAPKCAGADCPNHILDHNQAVVVMSNGSGTVAFCSASCLREALSATLGPQKPEEATSEQDLLQMLGYRASCEERDSG
jgi:hypothetical protein